MELNVQRVDLLRPDPSLRAWSRHLASRSFSSTQSSFSSYTLSSSRPVATRTRRFDLVAPPFRRLSSKRVGLERLLPVGGLFDVVARLPLKGEELLEIFKSPEDESRDPLVLFRGVLLALFRVSTVRSTKGVYDANEECVLTCRSRVPRSTA
jgi:hypothetical protein